MAWLIQPLTVSTPTSKLLPRWSYKSQVNSAIRCCQRSSMEGEFPEKTTKKRNYYELLGVSADSEPQVIKAAYRKLQKKYHPDIAGNEAHGYVMMLNEAYEVLMSENSRKKYDASIGQVSVGFGRSNSGMMTYSVWNGPLRPEALFVDENACIGCRECVHHACGTFIMDEAVGSARVKVQYGDDLQNIEVAVESCPVNCIHWVDREDLSVLEFLIQPQPKNGHGVFGQGWERPANVFLAAKDYKKQLKNEVEHQKGNEAGEEETPAQAEARANATMKMREERFSWLWGWIRDDSI
ncbi:hypothetical protein V2J09_004098 [Rumex salicifolius]